MVLRAEVAQRESERDRAEIALATARARLAKAEGKTELAIAEGRKVVQYRDEYLKMWQELYATGRWCGSQSELREAEGAAAIARAWLADVEDRRDVLLAELPKVIAYYEGQIRMSQALLKAGAIRETEAKATLAKYGEELGRAKERLAATKGEPGK
jgi:hypothetical protein